MERVSAFLESSTIHGLTYISTTRKYARAFWIIVVLTGFTGAGYLIQTSFQSWAESPIKTTIETLPISELKFPKVTVCPPKNTYTDLNHDLMVAENYTLTEEMRDELIEYSEKVIDEHTFTDDLEMVQEDDRYYNWYYGYSKIMRTFTDDQYDQLCYFLYTSATSGVVTTQYFRDQYQPSLVERKVMSAVVVYPPEAVRNNTNVTLHFNLEKVSMTGLTSGYDNAAVSGRVLEAGLTSVTVNFTPPAGAKGYRLAQLSRYISEDLTNIEMESMPGFRLSWHYSGLGDNVTPDSRFSDFQENKLFIRSVRVRYLVISVLICIKSGS